MNNALGSYRHSSRDGITKYHRLVGLNNRNLDFLLYWRLEVQDNNASMSGFFGGLCVAYR